VGGGSVLDIAKLIKALLATSGDPAQIMTGKTPVVDPNVPLIAVPTTAGSGSEATHFAVVYIGYDKFWQ
jgi:alcohol dehydrogenase class IV